MKTSFVKKPLGNGINLYICPTDKFKSITFCIFLYQELKKETATKTALLPFVLRRGTKKFPTSRKLNLHLDELYGTYLGTDVVKRGEIQIIQFFAETVNPEYVKDKEILQKTLFLLRELLLDPVTENGRSFKQAYVEQEKDVLKRNIESLYNDKLSYSIERCFQEMCKDEAYSIFKYGSIKDLKDINSENLYDFYSKEILKKCPMDIFVLGNVDYNKIEKEIQEVFSFPREPKEKPDTGFLEKNTLTEKIVIEKQDVNQGKLCLGFRTNTQYGGEDFFPLLVYNGILGGGPHSKLFQNVREKESLAYFAFSRIEGTKGLMLISSGIEFENYEKTQRIIKTQIEDMKSGNIKDFEFDSTIKSITNSLKESADSPSMLIGSYLNGIINDNIISIDDMIKKINTVTKDDVARIAQKIKFDTLYFLNKN